jgi:hypothetical protein
MCRLGVLWMAALLTEVYTAIERSTARISAVEAPRPLLNIITMQQLTVQLLILRTAEHLSLHFATVTTRINLDLASTAKTFMTRSSTGMFAAG